MFHRSNLPTLLTGAFAILALAACGTSSATSSSSSGSSSSSSSSSSSGSGGSGGSINVASCPSSSTVSSDLGVTVGAPTSDTGETEDLPAGATGVGCEYVTSSEGVVIIIVASGVPSGYLSTAEGAEQSALASEASGLNFSFTPVSGLGSQAASYSYTADGISASGVIAEQGSDVVGVFTSLLTTSVSSEESLVRALL